MMKVVTICPLVVEGWRLDTFEFKETIWWNCMFIYIFHVHGATTCKIAASTDITVEMWTKTVQQLKYETLRFFLKFSVSILICLPISHIFTQLLWAGNLVFSSLNFAFTRVGESDYMFGTQILLMKLYFTFASYFFAF